MSNHPSWYDLLPDHTSIQGMDSDQLDKANRMASGEIMTLAFGISGIGNLLVCTAGNDDTGLNTDSVESVGWMLESLGRLLANLSDTQGALQSQINLLSKTDTPKPPRA